MQQTVVPGVAMWSVWQPERNLYFNSFFIEHAEGNLAVDPLALPGASADLIAQRGGLAWVVVTNRDHERGARELAQRFSAKIAASAADAPLLTGPVERLLQNGERIADGRVIALEGLKTPGEFALDFAQRDAVLLGDALWGDPAGSLRLMPDQKLADPARAVLSLRKLWACRREHLLVGDGACIFGGAAAALGACLEARRDTYVNRINADELEWIDETPEHEEFAGSSAEIGHFIGARKLGYRLARLGPGKAWCPLHWHVAEEELFVVFKGTPTLITPRGSFGLRKGDFIAFPVGPQGAHKLVNDAAEPCTLLMLSNFERDEVCYYPDSHKLAVGELILRDHPSLDYFDAE
ncbi:MAG: cupin domain-containing protein [Vulcanimicrobiaceae bacterium]